MAKQVEVKVPNIGDFDEVPVIEVLVKDGDAVEKDAPLITLESEKSDDGSARTTGGYGQEREGQGRGQGLRR